MFTWVGLVMLAQATEPLSGAAGVCVRWADDPHHVAEAVVVNSSGNPTLDAALPESIEAMTWPAPTSPDYAGEWVGIRIAVGGSPSGGVQPDCSTLPLPDEATPTRSDERTAGSPTIRP